MRVPSDGGGSAQPSKPDPAPPPQQETRSFDKVLEQKSEGKAKLRAGKKRLEDPDGRGVALPSAGGQPFALRSGSSEAAGPAMTPDIQTLQGLVREIHVVSGSQPGVEMQFHSKTLEGLNVKIVKRGDQVSIGFLTGSESVAQLLSRNADQLSQALQAKGVQVGAVRVELSPVTTQSTSSEQSSRGRERGERDPRQDRRRQ